MDPNTIAFGVDTPYRRLLEDRGSRCSGRSKDAEACSVRIELRTSARPYRCSTGDPGHPSKLAWAQPLSIEPCPRTALEFPT
jgi:hypothetical protein